MLGTIINVIAIVVGTLIGTAFHRGIKDKYKDVMYIGFGLAALAIGLQSTIVNLTKSAYPVLFIIAISLGGLVGTMLDIDGRFKRAVDKFSHGKKKRRLADGLATATLLYCIGPLAMLGPIVAVIDGDYTFLFTNATLDFVSSVVFASTYGIGIVLTAPVVFVWQGAFYLIACISSTAISDMLMCELLIVGGLLITGSGLSLLNLKDCRVLNFLPSLLVPVLWFLIKYLLGF